jgi:PAS domain S-box-containing protein
MDPNQERPRDLQQLLETLQARHELLREVLARTGEAIFAKDRQGRYVMINQNGAWMFGKSVEEILGQDDTALFERDGADRIMAIDRAVMRTGKPQTFEEVLDVRGVPSTLLTTQTPWYEPGGTLCGLIGSARDVTEGRRTERLAEVQQDRLRSLASEIVIAEERLRQSLAADLHNSLGQDIALTKMKLAALRGSSSADLHDPLLRIERLVEQADRSSAPSPTGSALRP